MSPKVTLPSISWKLIQKNDELILDGEWEFPICSTSKQTYEIYIYEVKDFPELLKIGISKDSTKRTENYYGQLLWKGSFDKRTASMIEYLFMHSTYHKAHNSLPQQNVGNFAYATALPILKTFFDNVGHTSKGITEVRQMTFDEAKYTLKYIEDILITKDLFEVISICGIRTFEGLDGIRSVVTIKKGNTWHDSKFSLSENNELQSTFDVVVENNNNEYDNIKRHNVCSNCTNILVQRYFTKIRKRKNDEHFTPIIFEYFKKETNEFCELCDHFQAKGYWIEKQNVSNFDEKSSSHEMCVHCLVHKIFDLFSHNFRRDPKMSSAKSVEFFYEHSNEMCKICKHTRQETNVTIKWIGKKNHDDKHQQSQNSARWV